MRDDVLNSTACMIKVVAEDGRVREMLRQQFLIALIGRKSTGIGIFVV